MRPLVHRTMWCLRVSVLFWFAARLAAVSDASGDGVPQKYFHESPARSHSDDRFDRGPLSNGELCSRLSCLITFFLYTMNDIGAETWLMHGSLLGWYWNRKILPWDLDLDVQITEKSMQHLSSYYNMTVHRFELPGSGVARDYLLEINPNWTNTSFDDVDNKIDARWLDMSSGLYIDITTLRYDDHAEREEGVKAVVICKDGHRYSTRDIFPLADTTFEGVAAKVPSAFATVLAQEYGVSALETAVFAGHRFDVVRQEWMPLLASERDVRD